MDPMGKDLFSGEVSLHDGDTLRAGLMGLRNLSVARCLLAFFTGKSMVFHGKIYG